MQIVSASHLRFEARSDASPRPLWFYFRVEGAAGPAVRCDLANADACFGPRAGWHTVRPVYSTDGVRWQRVVEARYVDRDARSGYFSFDVPTPEGAAWVAYCYPYTTADLHILLHELSSIGGMRYEELCRTQEDLPVPRLRVDEGGGTSVWVLARQHAGETPASFTVDGLLREWLSQPELRASAGVELHVIPMVDVDGIYHGRYGKDQRPVDFNRDWQEEPQLPEVTALVDAMHTVHRRAPIQLVLDVHAPHHGDTSCYAFGHPAADEPALFAQQERLIRLLAEEGPQGVGFSPQDLRTDYRPRYSAREFLARTFRTQVLTLEMSYHLAQSGQYLTPELYRAFGGGLARAVLRCLTQ